MFDKNEDLVEFVWNKINDDDLITIKRVYFLSSVGTGKFLRSGEKSLFEVAHYISASSVPELMYSLLHGRRKIMEEKLLKVAAYCVALATRIRVGDSFILPIKFENFIDEFNRLRLEELYNDKEDS